MGDDSMENQLQGAGKTITLQLDCKLAGLLCYVPFAFINVAFSVLWLATEPKENRELRFHAMQGLCLAGAALILGVVISGFSAVLIPFGAWQMVHGLYTLETLAFLAGAVLGMINAYNGKCYKLPYIGDFVEKHL